MKKSVWTARSPCRVWSVRVEYVGECKDLQTLVPVWTKCEFSIYSASQIIWPCPQKPPYCKNCDQGRRRTSDICYIISLLCWHTSFACSTSLFSDDDLPDISQYILLVMLHPVADVFFRLISELPYSKGKEKAKALSASPVAVRYIPFIHLHL